MDMLYGLPQRDWLGLDERPAPEQPPPEDNGNSSIDSGS
jgi:hypothetical protein